MHVYKIHTPKKLKQPFVGWVHQVPFWDLSRISSTAVCEIGKSGHSNCQRSHSAVLQRVGLMSSDLLHNIALLHNMHTELLQIIALLHNIHRLAGHICRQYSLISYHVLAWDKIPAVLCILF